MTNNNIIAAIRKSKNIKKPQKRPKNKLFIALVILASIILITLTSIFAYLLMTVPKLDMEKFTYIQNAKIMDVRGEFYQDLQNSERRAVVTIDQIPKHVQDAFISIEDQRFRTHKGVDLPRLGKAVLNTIFSRDLEGPGGSTITQQLIKLTHLTSDKTVQRKFQELVLATRLENTYSKDQILESYLNKINLSHAWGVEAASQIYFGKSVNEISITQSAILAAMPQSPSYFDPYVYEGENRQLAKEEDGRLKLNPKNAERAGWVLDKMLELRHIDEPQHDKAIEEIKNNTTGLVDNNSDFKYSYFTDSVYEQVMEDLKKVYNYSDSEASDYLLNGGLTIYSTVDPKVQKIMEEKAKDESLYPEQSETAAVASKAKSEQTGSPVNYIPQVGMTIIDNKTGYVAGIVGGRDEKTNLSMNRALRKFQPGSATKPLTAYAPGLDTGAITLGTSFEDVPISYYGWQPGNASGGYGGPTTVRKGLTESINTVAVQANVQTGSETAADYGAKLGLDIVKDSGDGQTDITPVALALGGYTHGQTSLAMASAFSTFPDMGERTEPTFYTKVLDSKGKTILEKQQKKISIFKPQTAYLITDVLKDAVKGGTTNIYIDGQPVAGKTGTTDNNRHAWFCGYTPYYTMSVWYGYDENVIETPEDTYYLNINVYGGSIPGPAGMFSSVMNDVHTDLESAEFGGNPGNITTANIDRISGKLATDLTARDPRGSMVISEIFTGGTVPVLADDWHVEIELDIVSNAYATPYCPKEYVQKVVRLKKPANRFPAGITPLDPNFVAADEVDVLAPPDGHTCPLHTGPGSKTEGITLRQNGVAFNGDLHIKVGEKITVTADGPSNETTVFTSTSGAVTLHQNSNNVTIEGIAAGTATITVQQTQKITSIEGEKEIPFTKTFRVIVR